MVLTITAPLWADISDRNTRRVGTIAGHHVLKNEQIPVLIAGNDGLIVSPKPWWAYDQYGEVHAQDDFDGTLKWSQLTGTVTKASDPTFVHVGTSAMKMVTGIVAGNTATAKKWMTPPQQRTGYMVLELWWALTAAAVATPRDFSMKWSIQDAALNSTYTFGMRYLNYNATVLQWKVQYWTDASAWANVVAPSVAVDLTNPCFHYWLMIIKRTIGVGYEYTMVMHDERQHALPTTAPAVSAFGWKEQQVELACTTDVAAATTAYVGAIIVADGVNENWV